MPPCVAACFMLDLLPSPIIPFFHDLKYDGVNALVLATCSTFVICCFVQHGRTRSSEGIEVFRSILESARGKTMLDYTAFVNQLLVMHWSGTLQSMSRHGASRQQVLAVASSQHWFGEGSQSEMADKWNAVERQNPGTVNAELTKAASELEAARCSGHELAFPRLKRDVLQLAADRLS